MGVVPVGQLARDMHKNGELRYGECAIAAASVTHLHIQYPWIKEHWL